MFGFGKSSELEKREQALIAHERKLFEREKRLIEREKVVQQGEKALREWEEKAQKRFIFLQQREEEINKRELFAEAKLNDLVFQRQQFEIEKANFLNGKQKEANQILQKAKVDSQGIREQAYRQGIYKGRLEGLTSGKKDYRQLERERDAATKRAKNARFAAIRRKKKEEAEQIRQ